MYSEVFPVRGGGGGGFTVGSVCLEGGPRLQLPPFHKGLWLIQRIFEKGPCEQMNRHD